MKIKSNLALSLVLIAMPLALRATSFDEIYLEHYRPHSPDPVPIAIVVPKVDAKFVGTELTLKFVVDPSGRPRQIASATPGADPELVSEVATALKAWKFAPGYQHGEPVTRRVELPVSIVARHKYGVLHD